MGQQCSSSCREMAWTATVYFMVVLTICNAKECTLQMSDKLKDRSAFFTTTDIKLIQIQCMEVSCRQSYDESKKKIGRAGGSSVHQENQPKVMKPSCGSKVCNKTSVCLEKGCSKMCVQAPSFCDLHVASKTGNLTKVKVSLSHGRADIDCKEWNGRTPVLLAAGEGHTDVVHVLVSNGANMSVVDDFGINILHSACQGGNFTLVKYVLSLDKHDINGKVLCGATSAMLAAEHGHRDVVGLLVGQGANVSLQNKKGNNILHFACRGGDVEVVKYVLLQNMVDINSKGWNDMTPVMLAAENGHRAVVELLFRKGAIMSLKSRNKNNILHYACRMAHMEVVKYILSHNMVDINSRGYMRMTPVLTAAEHGHIEVLDLLFRKGANMALKSKNEYTILHYACRGGHVEVVKYILSHNMVDINSRGHRRMTSALIAARHGQIEVVELLFRNGANMSLKSGNKNNILHIACRRAQVEVVKYILSHNMVDINSRGNKRMTPVLTAAEHGHMEVVEFLLRKGANMSLKGNNENNILHYACRRGHVDVVKYILSHSMVDINSRNKEPLTPVMIAAKMGHRKVVELLVSKGADSSLQENTKQNHLSVSA